MLRALSHSLQRLTVSSQLHRLRPSLSSLHSPFATQTPFTSTTCRQFASVAPIDDVDSPTTPATDTLAKPIRQPSLASRRRQQQTESDRAKKTVDRLRKVMQREKLKLKAEEERAKLQRQRQRAAAAKEKLRTETTREKEREKLQRAQNSALLKEAEAAIQKQYQKLERHARPKPPVTAFTLFVKQNYAKLAQSLPIAEGQTALQRAQAIMAESARQWKAMSDEEKQVYRTEYQKARSAYDLQVAKYEQSDMFRPKRAGSGFALFVQDTWRPSGGAAKFENHLGQYAKQWQALSAEEKQKYNDRYTNLKKEYDERTQRYLQAREGQRESVLALIPARLRKAIQRSLGAAKETITLVSPGANASQPPQQKQ